MLVKEELADWEDSKAIKRKRKWFTIDEALQQLSLHKESQRRYLQQLKNSHNSAPISEIVLSSPNKIPETSVNSMTQQASNSLPI